MKDLIRGGLTLGKNVTIERTVKIDTNYPYLIRIGNNCSIAGGVTLLAHDATPFKYLGGHTRLGKIDIKDNVFIGSYAIILPGVTIGPNVVIAAGSVVNKDIQPNSCIAGVPARFYQTFDDFLAQIQKQISERPVFDFNELHNPIKNRDRLIERNKRVWDAVNNGNAFIKGCTGSYPYTLNPE
jgi:maltose O-acetyltransferase